jgi:haloalkane dehalogenase
MINYDETFRGTWPFKPNFFNGNGFKQHYIDEGPKDGYSHYNAPW